MNVENQTISAATPAPRVLFAGGGTGGHLFPAVAIAEAFLARNHRTRILFVGSGRPLERKIVPELGFASETISIEGMVGRGTWRQLIALFKLPRALWQSAGIIRRFKPDLVVGMGGYSAGPVLTAARLMGKPTMIHEQNAHPGVTNRMLARIAHKICVSFEETRRHFPDDKVMVTGNPVRREFLDAATREAAENHKANQAAFTLFIMGGSQGAHGINRIVSGALPLLKNKDRLFVIHQTGEVDEKMMKAAYEKNGVAHDVRAFFSRIYRQYAEADLVICRAGATTVAEVAAMAKPAVFIPFPFHTDQHQVINARGLVEAGGAEMVLEKELTPEMLAEKIDTYAAKPEKIEKMVSALKTIGTANAAQTIVKQGYRLMHKGFGPEKHEETA